MTTISCGGRRTHVEDKEKVVEEPKCMGPRVYCMIANVHMCFVSVSKIDLYGYAWSDSIFKKMACFLLRCWRCQIGLDISDHVWGAVELLTLLLGE